jgi:hypothetical protein
MARTYPWKVSADLWKRVEPLLPSRPAHPKGGRPAADDRQMFTAIIYVLRTGIQWNALPCKRQGDSEPSAVAKLSHLLAIQMIRMLDPVSVNSGESESSHLPSSECGCDGPADLRELPSCVHSQKPGSIEQTPGSR